MAPGTGEKTGWRYREIEEGENEKTGTETSRSGRKPDDTTGPATHRAIKSPHYGAATPSGPLSTTYEEVDMTTLAIPCALRNLRIQLRKLTGRYGARLSQLPDGVALIE